jgi:succinate dehydrogenase flavin-adding protein (antitoxin of CptAB toxin-antitoxin module)
MLPYEILLKIVEYDEMARELYTHILENTNSQVFLTLCSGKDTEFFYIALKQMIEDEIKHISMVRKISSLIERIQ